MVQTSQVRGHRVKDFLNTQELAYFTRRSNLRGAWAILGVWLGIACCFAAMAAVTYLPLYAGLPLFVVGFVALGGRQLGLSILTHEAAHTTLFANKWCNDVLTDWLAAKPVWNSVIKFRAHHMVHHANTTADIDPDKPLYSALPVSKASHARKFLRDLIGLTGLKFYAGRLLMSAGILKWSDAIGEIDPAAKSRHFWQFPLIFIKNTWGTILTNGALFFVLAATGHAWLYGMWILAYTIPFPFIIRIRAMAEHAGLAIVPDTLRNTRTTYAGLLGRMTVAPLNVNYHMEHHLVASTPYYRLPELHQHLLGQGKTPAGWTYRHVLNACTI
ncbi:MAG: fatty acid desaturase family protein [Paraperlucidibaca sp.]